MKLEVTAAPEGGRANQAVEQLIAAQLNLKKSQVSVVRGAASRNKVIEITGLDMHELERRIQSNWPGRHAADE